MLRRVLTPIAMLTLAVVLLGGCGPKEEDSGPAPAGGGEKGVQSGNAPTATTTIPLSK